MSKKMSRREWSMLSVTGLAGFMMPSSLISCKTAAAATGNNSAAKAGTDVIIGVQTYSFRDMNLPDALKAMNDIGIKSCELFSQHLEPADFIKLTKPTPEEWKKQKDALKKWRATVSMNEVKEIRERIEKAGITIQSYSDTFPPKDSDADFEQVFKIAQALGSDTITTSATLDVVKRIDALAQKYNMKVGMHNHSHVEDPNQFSSEESFLRGMRGNSDLIRINLDIGHFTAANFDAVDFIKRYHEKIVCIHIKDRKKNQGPNVPLGEGDTPIADVLKLIRDNKWAIPANIEYEYKGDDTVAEVKRCYDYCKKILTNY